ncbi:subtilisin-like protein [Lophiostoma macrostomum CBS 122681]|uniref:Subtilisin-like protein n=1 Tax=Lophiostoma macrostomum CBS 122681 TaxID=1314788 RepID=A0A6A6TQS0_9PLEO|nr:subtilisin-like protein [Lophiostoma macrostomum CBS 122681]
MFSMYQSIILFCVLFFSFHLGSARAVSRKLVTAPRSTDRLPEDDTQGNTCYLLTIGLTLQNTQDGVSSLLAMSDPDSLSYGQHWTAARVANSFRPDPASTAAVVGWMRDSGLNITQIGQSNDGGHLYVPVCVEEATRLFNRTLGYFTNRKTGGKFVGSNEFELPTSIDRHIEYIAADEGHLNPKTTKRKLQRETSSNHAVPGAIYDCNDYTTPLCLRSLYGIPEDIEPHPDNSFGIYQQAWQSWSPTDLDVFFAIFDPALKGQRPIMAPIDGGYTVDYTDTSLQIPAFYSEASLDFEYAMVLTARQNVTNIQVGDQLRNIGLGTMNSMLAAFDQYYCDSLDPDIDPQYPDDQDGGYDQPTDCGTVQPPNVISVSYTWPEANFPAEYLQRVCFEYLKLGLMGVSVVVSVSDTGTGSGILTQDKGLCLDTDSGETDALTGNFSPTFPSSCPWVTSVGGTQLASQAAGGAPIVSDDGNKDSSSSETVFNFQKTATLTLSSGGGFSNVFTAPVFQYDAIQQYKDFESDHLSNFEDRFNATGRGYPDVSALANNYLVFFNGKMRILRGSSASTPVFASIITLINNERLNAGKRPLGFLNPAIWKYPGMFNDILMGANEGCGIDPAFQANDGWDPVTGWGSPDYDRMRDTLLNLP